MTQPLERSVFLTRVVLKNYRSIAACDVALGPLTFLVGPNGAGKSNFLDALNLTASSLRTSIEHALRDRGGINQVRRRSGGHPTHFGVRLEFRLPEGTDGTYAFEVGARAGGFTIKQEDCAVGMHHYKVVDGSVIDHTVNVVPPASADRLYLVSAAGLPEFRPAYDAVSRMGFYNIRPETIRAHQEPDQGELLKRDGSNLASVVRRMKKMDGGKTLNRVQEFLSQVVPGITGVDYKEVGHLETLEFRQQIQGRKDPWRFPAINMSDGTLRALSILVALFQPGVRGAVPLVGIEEPEAALHPAAAGVLLDALRSGARHTQVVVTSHSPDLLESDTLSPEDILSVESDGGTTMIGPVDGASRSALSERLYSAGELLRANQLQTDHAAVPSPKTLDLFSANDR